MATNQNGSLQPKNSAEVARVDQPRERLLERGAAALADAELLAIVLGAGVSASRVGSIAKELLSEGLSALPGYAAKDLLRHRGVRSAKAARVLAAVELGRRLFAKEDVDAPPAVNGPEDAVRLVRHIRRARKEHFLALFLNARHQLIKLETISIGTLNASLVHPREVFQPAVGESAAAVILAHNHPSGDPAPSEEDLQLTARLVQAGRIMGIEVLDHIIVTNNSFLSLKARHWVE